jgi:hypothetical protein
MNIMIFGDAIRIIMYVIGIYGLDDSNVPRVPRQVIS